MGDEHGIRCMVMRGGTSKGLYFLADDLPDDPAERDDLLLRVMGSPDARQIDGLGGAHPLTSKVAVVGPGTDGVDVDYHFLQVAVDEPQVTDHQNCGNLLAGVGPFALERGLVAPAMGPSAGAGDVRHGRGSHGPVDRAGGGQGGGGGTVDVRIRMVNTGGVATARVPLRDGRPRYEGDTAISGVPGTAAPIRLDFEDVAGSTCGALLPTGHPIDEVCGLPVTLIDNGMPLVVLRATDLGVRGDEPCAELEANARLREILEQVRLAAGPLMHLGDVSRLTVPKLTLVSPPRAGGWLCTRTFIPHRCHDAIGVLGAVSLATAALLREGPAAEVARAAPDAVRTRTSVDGATGPVGPTHHTDAADLGEGPVPAGGAGAAGGVERTVVVEHPTGRFEAVIGLAGGDGEGPPVVRRAGIIRTARKLMDGVVFPR